MSGRPFVFVLDRRGKPLMPCTGKRARLLLERGRARIHKLKPFTIRLVDRFVETSVLQNIEIKIDPGSKYTGIAISRTEFKTVNVLNLFEIEHRGHVISKKLKARAAMRRARRNRNTRYRKPRFLNRTKSPGWLPPSLMHRVDTTMAWINRFQRYTPVTSVAVERVKFDMQKLRDPEISGIEYQRGTLFEKEVMEYLLAKWGRECVYCGVKDRPLEKEHILPRVLGGTNAISNLTLSCRCCNQKKGALPIQVFLNDKPALLSKILNNAKKPLKDAAAVNATRNRLFSDLLKTGLPVATGTGAQTKFNRSNLYIPKTHALDAACVGDIIAVNHWYRPHIAIQCMGRGRYSRTLLNKYGFPRAYCPSVKKAFGFQTGDLVRVFDRTKDILKSVIGKVMIRQSGYFAATIGKKLIQTKWNLCKLIQRADGYSYSKKEYTFLNTGNQPLTVGQL